MDAPPLPSGLRLVNEFLTPKEHDELLLTIDTLPWDHILTRRTQHYGYRYNYDTREPLAPTTPIPEHFHFLLDRLVSMGLPRPDQLIINEYKPGQGIGMHTDHIHYFDDTIVSISLGSAIVMDFDVPRTPQKTSMVLKPCSALILQGEARWMWRHGIVGRKRDSHPDVGDRKRRVSLTFRKVKHGRGY